MMVVSNKTKKAVPQPSGSGAEGTSPGGASDASSPVVAQVVTQSSIGKSHRLASKQTPLAGSIGQAPLAGSDVPLNEPTDDVDAAADAEEKDDKSQSLTQQLGKNTGFGAC